MSTVATALTVRYTMLGFMLKLVTASCLFMILELAWLARYEASQARASNFPCQA
jgi:hypothetical protein